MKVWEEVHVHTWQKILILQKVVISVTVCVPSEGGLQCNASVSG